MYLWNDKNQWTLSIYNAHRTIRIVKHEELSTIRYRDCWDIFERDVEGFVEIKNAPWYAYVHAFKIDDAFEKLPVDG